MKRAWTRGEKWLWATPILFSIVAVAMNYGPNAARRAMGWPQELATSPNTSIRSMALSGNGEVLAAGGMINGKGGWKRGSGTIYLWHPRTLARLAVIPPIYTRDRSGFTHGFDIYGLTLSPDAGRIGFSRAVENWGLYDVKSQIALWRFREFIADAEFSRDGRFIALSGDKSIFLVDARDGRVKSQWKRNGTPDSRDISLSSDGGLVASIGSSNQSDPIELHRAEDWHLIYRIKSKGARSVRFSPDNKQLLVAASVGSYSSTDVFDTFAPVRCYESSTGKLKWEVKSKTFGGADGLHSTFCDAIFSPDGRTVAAYQHGNGQIFLLDSASGKIKTTLSLGIHERSNFYVPTGLAFSPDSKRLFARVKNAILIHDLK